MSGDVNFNSCHRGNSMLHYNLESLQQLLVELEFAPLVGKDNTVNVPASFDTETSSFYDDYGDKVAVCYIWMFGIGDTIVYGRELDEFQELVNKLEDFLAYKDKKLIVYVHNLKFDFHFIHKYFKWDNVFLRKAREPLYARYHRIEFRDSLVLAGGRSLAKISSELRRDIHKAAGDMDYDKIRFSETPLTDKEMHYCEMDIRALNEYIREKIEDEGSIKKIPYTNTGYVRRYVKEACFKKRAQYLSLVDNLTLTPDCYIQAEQAFTGGAVGGNKKYIAKLMRNVHSYDIKSSYPYVMCTKYFPMSFFRPVSCHRGNYTFDKIPDNIKEYLSKYCCLFEFEAYDVVATNSNFNCLSISKCQEIAGYREYSNHVVSAFYIKCQMTELDFDMFCKYYSFSECHFDRFRIAERGYLPEAIIKSVLKFFNDKTTLDGIKERKADYMIAKNMLNSVYGMMVERIVRQVIKYINDKGIVKLNPDYVDQIIKYNNKYDRFLFYPWGVWVTAHARYRLFDAILSVGDDFVYCDTDSVKYIGNHDEYFNRINSTIEKEMYRLAECLRLSPDYVIPTTPKGKKACLGVWSYEGTYNKFKTLGAKRYMIEYDNGEQELTVAGSNKKRTFEYIKKIAKENNSNVFDKFDFNLVIPEEYSGRTTSTYIDEEKYGWATDYLGNRCYYHTLSGIHIEKSSYTFSETESMKNAIEWLLYDAEYEESQID